jgi:hypothetical protein
MDRSLLFIKSALKPLHRLGGWDVRHKGINLVIICMDGSFQATLHLPDRGSNHPAKTHADTHIAYRVCYHVTAIIDVYFPALTCEQLAQWISVECSFRKE